MLLLTFRLGDDRYGIDATDIIELLPLTTIKRLPRAPHEISGLLDYRGSLIPAVDLSLLAIGRPARPVMSTRMAVVRCGPTDEEGTVLAVVLEHAIEVVRRDRSDFAPSGVDIPEAPYLSDVARDGGGAIQQIDVRQLIPEELRRRFLSSAAGRPEQDTP